MRLVDLGYEPWFVNLEEQQQLLLQQAFYLLQEAERKRPGSSLIVDYGYIVYPAAKVYEGFLKHFFYRLGLIAKREFRSEHFRIGKALNPDLPEKYRDEGWVYESLNQLCSKEVTEMLWLTWRRCRNKVFHFQEEKRGWLSLAEARERLEMILLAMAAANQCEVKLQTRAGVEKEPRQRTA